MSKSQAIVECPKFEHPFHNTVGVNNCFKCDDFIKFELGYVYCKEKGE